MIEYFQERPLLGVFVGAIIVVTGMLLYAQRSQEPAADATSVAPDETARMKEIRSTEYSDPVSALALVRSALNTPESKRETEFAVSKLPDVLTLCFRRSMESRNFEQARGYLDELKRDAPHSFQALNTEQDWGRSLRSRWREAVGAPDSAQADALFDEIVAGDYIDRDVRFLGDYQRTVSEKWTDAMEQGDKESAQVLLTRASAVLVSATPNNPLVDALYRADWAGQDQFELAESLSAGRKHATAIPLYQSAVRKLESGLEGAYGTRVELDHAARETTATLIRARVVEALVSIGDSMRLGQQSVVTTLTAKEIYRDAALNSRDAKARVVPLRRQLGVEIDEFIEASDPMNGYAIQQVPDEGYLSREDVELIYKLSQEAQRNAGNILYRTAAEVWESMLKDPDFDPWSLVTADVVNDIKEAFPSEASEGERRVLLGEKARDRAYPIPLSELPPVRERINQVDGRFGLLTFSSNSDHAITMLRRAVRGTKTGRYRAEIAEGLKTLIRQSRDTEDFDALYELAGFYASEIGVSAKGDPFREEFRTSIEGAAESFRERSRMKYVFLLTVLAKGYPDERVGLQAREEALRLAFEEVSGVKSDSDLSGDYTASGLPGLSVFVVENSTSYHLLTFFRGPESFFVDCYPYRRGSIVLQDGKYEMAVLSPSGGITPYHGQVTLTSEAVKSVYTIHKSDEEDSQPLGGSSALGSYTVLHAPDELRDLKIDSRTGEVKRDRLARVSNFATQ
jgi:tetratricopeptide (TPR) repeat protein